MNMLIDVHAHLDFPTVIDKVDEIVQRAEEAGVKVIITNGIDAKSNRKVLKLAEKYPIVKPALGIYPPDALKSEAEQDNLPFEDIDIDAELDFIRSQDPIAIGEIGLEYKYGKDHEMQKDLFRKLIQIAKEKDIPVLVHSRKAELDTIDILEESGYKKVVLHCFSGRKHLAKRAVELGFYFSIPTNIVKSEHFQNIVKMVHISKILTETDTPYLSPFKDTQNEPAFVAESLKKIAEIKGMTVEDTANAIFQNYQNIFM